MIREGAPNVTLRYLSDEPNKLAISNFSDGMSLYEAHIPWSEGMTD